MAGPTRLQGSLALPKLLSHAAPLLAGLTATALYLGTQARTHPADAMAYADELAQGMTVHPQHLLHGVVGAGLVEVGGWLRPELVAFDHLTAGNAIFGGVGIGLFVLLARKWGVGTGLSLVLAAALASSQGWWTLSTTWEVHVLPVSVVLGGLWLLSKGGRKRILLGGATLGTAILLHKTMLLALPAIAIGLAWRRGLKQAASAALVASGVVALGYGLAWLSMAMQAGVDPVAAASNLLLGEVQSTSAVPVDGSRLTALGQGAAQVFTAAAGGPCVVSPLLVSTSPSAEMRDGIVQLVAIAGALAGLLALAGSVLVRRQRPLATSLVLGWPLVALPLVAWFEPNNLEYHLGPLAMLLLGLGLGAHHLSKRVGLSPAALPGIIALIGIGNGWVTWSASVGPSTLARDHIQCNTSQKSRSPDAGQDVLLDDRGRPRFKPRGRRGR